ncbi:MAG: hypothetical protein F6K47_31725 [Symploca sp. SIO2E6]|nr:hypothetical protein [Symploca sp. SIO2E6]
MTIAKSTPTARRGRIFPEIQWTEEKKAQKRTEREVFYQRCKPIFDRVQPELIKTRYNWYVAIEPDSGEYFLAQDDLVVAQIAHQKYPNAKLHVFRINETGVCGTI